MEIPIYSSYGNLGNTHQALYDAKEALQCQKKALGVYLKIYGEQHPAVATLYWNIGMLYQSDLKDIAQARTAFEKALLIYTKLDRQKDICEVNKELQRLVDKQPIISPIRPPQNNRLSYFSFFYDNPGKTALFVGGAVVAGVAAYLSKPGGGK